MLKSCTGKYFKTVKYLICVWVQTFPGFSLLTLKKNPYLLQKWVWFVLREKKKLNEYRMFWNPCSLLIWLDWFSKNYVYCFISYTIPHVAEHRDHSVHKLSLVSKEDTAFSQISNKSQIRTRWLTFVKVAEFRWHDIT